jgi:hypothetical protein
MIDDYGADDDDELHTQKNKNTRLAGIQVERSPLSRRLPPTLWPMKL